MRWLASAIALLLLGGCGHIVAAWHDEAILLGSSFSNPGRLRASANRMAA
jgi:hypothetical protein